jgi:hypothetical protein
MTYCEIWWDSDHARAVGGFSFTHLARMAHGARSEGLSPEDVTAAF